MPIVLKLRIKKGWKSTQNNRYGNCIVIEFRDLKTQRVLFEYAPKIGDQVFWNKAFTALTDYNEALTELQTMEDKIDETQAEPLNCNQVKK